MIAVEEVFDEWNATMLRSLRRRFHGVAAATLEEGAGFAWEKLIATPPASEENLLGWLIVVAQHEVLRLIRRWERAVEIEADPSYRGSDDGHVSAWGRLSEFQILQSCNRGIESLDDRLEARELLARLDALNPGQRIALTCRLLGLSYEEAMQATGRTYTWVNRHITEGRRALEATS